MPKHTCPAHCSECRRCIGVPNKTVCDSCATPRETITDIWQRVFG